MSEPKNPIAYEQHIAKYDALGDTLAELRGQLMRGLDTSAGNEPMLSLRQESELREQIRQTRIAILKEYIALALSRWGDSWNEQHVEWRLAYLRSKHYREPISCDEEMQQKTALEAFVSNLC